MIVKVLVENTAISESFGFEHGLSLYIESNERKILFDVGASDLFLQNARKMNVDIAAVDYVVLSHGHADHGGGLKAFLRENDQATVFVSYLGFEPHFATRNDGTIESIGLDASLKNHRQIMSTSGFHTIEPHACLFSGIPAIEPFSQTNAGLLQQTNGKLTADTFSHEQFLSLEENGQTIIFSGCSHAGIVNILKHFQQLRKRWPDVVLGGFHLTSRSCGDVDLKDLDNIAAYLVRTGASFHTGHCTGKRPYTYLQSQLGQRLGRLSSGQSIIIETKRSQ